MAESQGRTCKTDTLEDYGTMTHEYYPGKKCRCEARSSYECGCDDVDWTPKEVYELRADLEFCRELYKAQTAQLDKMRNERDEAHELLDVEVKKHNQTHKELVEARCKLMTWRA